MVWYFFSMYADTHLLLEGNGAPAFNLFSNINGTTRLAKLYYARRQILKRAIQIVAAEEGIDAWELCHSLRTFKYDWVTFYMPKSDLAKPEIVQKRRCMARLCEPLSSTALMTVEEVPNFLDHKIIGPTSFF